MKISPKSSRSTPKVKISLNHQYWWISPESDNFTKRLVIYEFFYRLSRVAGAHFFSVFSDHNALYWLFGDHSIWWVFILVTIVFAKYLVFGDHNICWVFAIWWPWHLWIFSIWWTQYLVFDDHSIWWLFEIWWSLADLLVFFGTEFVEYLVFIDHSNCWVMSISFGDHWTSWVFVIWWLSI